VGAAALRVYRWDLDILAAARAASLRHAAMRIAIALAAKTSGSVPLGVPKLKLGRSGDEVLCVPKT
jgi:hypothetical protein